MLVGYGLAAAHAGIGRNDQHRLGIVDTGSQRTGSKTTENHRVDGADAGCGQDGEGCLGNHRHVNQNSVALLDAEVLVNRRHALDFTLQFSKAIDSLFVSFGRDEDQRAIIRTLGRMTVNRVITKIGFAIDKPLGKRWARIIAHLGKRFFPVDELGLLGPELIRLFDGILVKLFVCRHKIPQIRFTCTRK